MRLSAIIIVSLQSYSSDVLSKSSMRKKHVVFNIQQQRKNELETFSARVFEFVLHLISLAITRFA